MGSFSLEMAIFDCVTLVPQSVLFAWYNAYMAKLKRPWRYIVSYVGLSISLVFLNDMSMISRTTRTWFTYIILFFLIGFFVSKENKMIAYVTTFVNTMVTVACEAIGIVLYYLITNDFELDVFNHPNRLVMGRTIFCLIYVIMGNIFCHYIAKGRKIYERRLNNAFVTWFVLQCVCLLFFTGQNNDLVMNDIRNLCLCILVCFICILANVGTYFYLQELDRGMEEICRKEQLVVQMEHQKQREQEILEDIRKAQKIKTDIMEGISNARKKLQQKDASGSRESLEGILEQIRVKELFCKNRVVDALLSAKNLQCMEKNIRLETDLNIDNEAGIENVDLCIIIANLLDNAIRACEKNQERSIRLAIRKNGKYLIIRQENSYNGDMENRKNGVISEHGLGLGIIERIAEKHEGWIEINRDKEKFITLVMLKIQYLNLER